MERIRIAGVMRAGEFSPNSVEKDAAVFMAVAEALRARGCTVSIYREEEFLSSEQSEETVVNMCRRQTSLQKLIELERQGRTVINSGFGIANCTRERMTRLLIGSGIPHPDSLIIDTGSDPRPSLDKAGIGECWVKRGDSHSVLREDVVYCHDGEEARKTVSEYRRRGIRRAVINRHLKGDLVKFYGVAGTPFFHWFYPFDQGHSKYGQERVNGLSHGFCFDADALRDICGQAARTLDVAVYGGDCIVAADGTARIIDFNDWPSFSPCRDEAARYIAGYVLDGPDRENRLQ